MLKYQETPTGRNAAIRRLYKTGKWSLSQLAMKYGITRSRVHQIVQYLTDGKKGSTILDR